MMLRQSVRFVTGLPVPDAVTDPGSGVSAGGIVNDGNVCRGGVIREKRS